MHKGTPTGRGPRPAARVGYHMGIGLATTFTRADCRDVAGKTAQALATGVEPRAKAVP